MRKLVKFYDFNSGAHLRIPFQILENLNLLRRFCNPLKTVSIKFRIRILDHLGKNLSIRDSL